MRKFGTLPFGLLCSAAVLAGCAGAVVGSAPTRDTFWPTYGGSPGFTHYSDLSQITPRNVSQLQVAWTYDLGDDISVSNPLMIGGRVYLVGAGSAIVALDAATGRELWKQPGLAPRARGLAYWSSADGKDQRILYTKDNFLRALDARTGAPIEGFSVDLKQGLDRDPASISVIQPSSPGVVYGDIIIMGSLTGEDYGSPPGDIRAYDIRTGKQAWSFKTIPAKGEPGAETWPENARATQGGANDWTGFALDEKRGVVYAVTGSSVYDFWGVDRPGDNRFANSLLALDARTGKLLWDFQVVHHDLWDYDIPTPPVLITVKHDGKPMDAVVVAGKTGFLYAFDRMTGKPLWPIEERPVPQGGVAGEKLSPTQPFPTKLAPFGRQTFTVDDIDPSLPAEERQALAAQMTAARNDGIFTPPGTGDVVQMPGSIGATNWGMLSGDPKRGMAYVVSTDVPAIIKLSFVDPKVATARGATPFERGLSVYKQNCAACHGEDRQGGENFPSLVGVANRLTPSGVAAVVHGGRGRMPAFPGIADATLKDLVSYLADNHSAGGQDMTKDADGHPADPAGHPADVKAKLQPARWRTEFGYVISKITRNPMIKPPWSSLTAYDMNTGDVVWRRPIGTDPNYTGPRDEPTGIGPARVGAAVTGGGLLFVGTSRDRTLHAVDVRTGKTVWTSPLPGAASGLPSVYAVGGRQFVLVPAASSRAMASSGESRAHNAFVAFALPAKH